MNTIPLPPACPLPARPRSWRRAVFITIVVLVVAVLGGITVLALSFLPGRSVRTLRRAALEAEPSTWERRFEFGVGRLPVSLARTALRAVDLPPEARAALQSIHCADVGIYQRRFDAPTPTPEITLDRVRTAMQRDGWQPVVLVRDGQDTVAVFVTTQSADSDTRLSAAIFVMNRDDLVLVSARADLGPLLEILPDQGVRLPLTLAHR